MEILSVGAQFFHADGWRDTMELIVAFRNFANEPKNVVYDVYYRMT